MKTLFLNTAAIACALASFASWAESPDNSWFIGAGAGAGYPGVYHNFRVHAGVGWPDDTYNNSSTESTPLLSLFGGYMLATNCKWVTFYSVGLNYTNAFSSMYRGTLMQYSLPEFQNYNYQYRVKRQTLLGFFKTNLLQVYDVLPFITLAAGVSANTADHYSERPIGPITPRVSPAFKGKTTTYFSYTVGGGLDYVFPPRLRLSLEYAYGYFGFAQTDTAPTGQYLRSNLTANSVDVNFTYYFDDMA